MHNNRKKTFSMINMALSAAFIAVSAQLAIPLPSGIPLTLQTLAVALCGYLLGAKLGAISSLVYVALGAMGAPVFSGFSGGFHRIVSLTGGFLWGFPLLALFCGLSQTQKWSRHEKLYSLLHGTLGVLLCHLCGIIQFSAISQSNLFTAALISSLPYLLKDAVCVALAYLLSAEIRKRAFTDT
ncbi:MAG: biotin transporter BioY [Clostridia bacterium]|nr:biotin transporter BioY [Clostridia bacterium]